MTPSRPRAPRTSGPADACRSTGGGTYDCQVWRTAKSCTASGAEAGVWKNVWWAKTDDSGNTGVYVSGVYLKGGNNDEPVPGLPAC